MNNLVFGVLLAVGCAGILVSFVLARRRGVFAQDGFAEPNRRSAAVVLLGAVLLLTVAIPFAGGLAGNRADTKNLTVVSLFLVHFILIGFLAFYYLLSGHRSVSEFLKLRSHRPAADLSAGLLIGVAGWLLTIVALVTIVFLWFVMRRQGVAGGPPREVSPTILWIVAQPLWIRIAIVVSAMVVEELFFRSFLQTRVGPVAATLMFTAAHGVYGQPLVLVGILVISTVLSVTFVLYGNVLPCIVAHGTFDAIQMFVLIPLALKGMSAGAGG
ncbi:MAG TPA: CPBP family intramembrane glutamic endopeptidase [Thermoanaerobaculia bacterium]|nr:CPBP family intramembrane glutamic endopeptidase [Thermoanaerobaculia bacterium]